MAETVLVQLAKDLTPTYVYVYDDEQQSAQLIDDKQAAEQQLQSAKDIIVLLPAAWIYLTMSRVPSKSQEVLKQSIPYSIEDELANEVEANDYAWFSRSDHLQAVAVISQQKRKDVYQWIKEQRLSVRAIYSEVVFCPAKEDCLSVWYQQDRALVRFGQESSIVCEAEQLPELVNTFAGDLNCVWSNRPIASVPQTFKVKPQLTLNDCCAYLVMQPPEPNLLKPELLIESTNKRQRSGKVVLVLALVLLLSWVFISFFQGYRLSSTIKLLKASQQQLLSDAFGQLSVTEQNDPFAALQSRLKQYSQSSDRQHNTLLDGFYYLGETRAQIPIVQLKGLRLFDNQLEIQITAPSIANINQFQQQLQNHAGGYAVNIGVNELSDGVYQSILTMNPR